MTFKVFSLMALFGMLPLVGCAGNEGTALASPANNFLGTPDAKVRLKVGTTTAPDGHYVAGLKYMQEKLEEYSGKEITLDIYPNSQLGNERDMMENVGLGAQDMALISTGPIPNFEQDFAVLDLPYIFKDEQQAHKILDGSVGSNLLTLLDKHGIYGVGFWENGFRQLSNNKKEILSPGDLRGMKIRTMENIVHMQTYNDFGASATPMAWSEIFSALQQGTVDGQENPIAIIESAKVYEVQKYITMVDLFYSPCVLMISRSVYDRLDDNQKGIFKRAADEAKVYQRNYSEEYTKGAIARMEEQGVIVNSVDKNKWQGSLSLVDMASKLRLNIDIVNQIIAQQEK